jgi:hypothetical protein
MYKIKPLEWKIVDHDYPDMEKLYKAITPICYFEIEKWKDGEWIYQYCFDEYYDDGAGGCLNLQDGKNACEKIWVAKLEKCLILEESNA